MKFGLFHEISVPRPFSPGVEKQVFDNALEQTRLADRLGFDQVWAVEHHFLEEYSHCSAPEVFLTAAAMVTENIRIGHGIATCVPEINHPARIAERCATLDIISNGRLEVGTGRSATWNELGGFRANPDRTKASWDEYVRAIPKMWTQERFSHQGTSFTMPERGVIPKPLQTPHPPLWVAVTSPGTEMDAAERGLGHLGVSLGGQIAAQEKRIDAYRRRIQSCDPVGEFVNEQVNVVNFLFCHEDHEHAVSTGERLAAAFSSAAAQTMEIKQSYPAVSYETAGQLGGIRRQATEALGKGGVPEGLVYGSPDTVIETIKRWESAGVDRIVFLLNALETIPQEEVLWSMELFHREVMPAFASDDRADQASEVA